MALNRGHLATEPALLNPMLLFNGVVILLFLFSQKPGEVQCPPNGYPVRVSREPSPPRPGWPGGTGELHACRPWRLRAGEIVSDVNNSTTYSKHTVSLIGLELPPTVSWPGPGPQIPGG